MNAIVKLNGISIEWSWQGLQIDFVFGFVFMLWMGKVLS
jgi:hypothetical protein